MTKTSPIFFKVPVTTELNRSVRHGVAPSQTTVAAYHVPAKIPRPNTRSAGMKPLGSRRIILQCFEAFKRFMPWLVVKYPRFSRFIYTLFFNYPVEQWARLFYWVLRPDFSSLSRSLTKNSRLLVQSANSFTLHIFESTSSNVKMRIYSLSYSAPVFVTPWEIALTHRFNFTRQNGRLDLHGGSPFQLPLSAQ